MTIDQIEKVIKVCKSSKKGDLIPDLKDVLKMLENLVLEQTNLKSLSDVEKILFFYKSYKNEDWFKQGIRQVLENGTFPEIIREITVPSTTWPDPLKQNPYHPIFPKDPIITWTSSVNLNDYKGISEVLDSIEDMLK